MNLLRILKIGMTNIPLFTKLQYILSMIKSNFWPQNQNCKLHFVQLHLHCSNKRKHVTDSNTAEIELIITFKVKYQIGIFQDDIESL
jgi:hypothetical protein